MDWFAEDGLLHLISFVCLSRVYKTNDLFILIINYINNGSLSESKSRHKNQHPKSLHRKKKNKGLGYWQHEAINGTELWGRHTNTHIMGRCRLSWLCKIATHAHKLCMKSIVSHEIQNPLHPTARSLPASIFHANPNQQAKSHDIGYMCVCACMVERTFTHIYSQLTPTHWKHRIDEISTNYERILKARERESKSENGRETEAEVTVLLELTSENQWAMDKAIEQERERKRKRDLPPTLVLKQSTPIKQYRESLSLSPCVYSHDFLQNPNKISSNIHVWNWFMPKWF